MSDNPPLLTPVSLEALVVNSAVQNQGVWFRDQVDYQNINKFESPLPEAGAASPPPKAGVHLHWSLPKALTTGTQIRALAQAELDGSMVAKTVKITNAGFGYVVPPSVIVSGGGGTGATAVSHLDVTSGTVTKVEIVSQGKGYTTPPRIEIAPSPEICFPLVPNRWMVTRFDPLEQAGVARKTTSWMLTSDFVDSDLGTSNYVNPQTSSAENVVPTKVGKSELLAQWQGESSPDGTNLFMRAIGPGDASFHTYQPGVENVFGFFDDLGTAASEKPAPFVQDALLSYMVVGWYSDPTADPMYGAVIDWGADCSARRGPWAQATDPLAAWDQLMADLNWTLRERPEDTAQLPNSSIYHALLHSVKWQNTGIPPRVNSTLDHMTVAVGQTSSDALAALIKRDADQLVKKALEAAGKTPAEAAAAGETLGALEALELEALNFNALQTLDQPDGKAQLDLKIRDAWYSSVPGGIHWEVVPANDTSTDLMSPQAPPPATPLTSSQANALAQLNKSQVELDKELRILQSMKFDLYALWWKDKYNAAQSAGPFAPAWQNSDFVEDPAAIVAGIKSELNPENPTGLWAKVEAKQKDLANKFAVLPVPTDVVSITKYAQDILKLDLSKNELKAAAAPSFYGATDPVVLVSGLQPSAKQASHQPQFDMDEGWSKGLVCRTPDQTAVGVKVVNGASAVDVTAHAPAAALAGVVSAVTSSNFTPTVQTAVSSLLVEAFFADPINADSIVTVAQPGASVPDLAAAMTAMTAQIGTPQPPLAVPFAYTGWAQAWAPLYLDWKVSYFPTVMPDSIGADDTQSPDNWPFNLDQWKFNGLDYDWTGGNTPGFDLDHPDAAPLPRTYNGRTFLTQQSTFALISRLHHYIQTNSNPEAGLEKVEALIAKVGEMNFMSQSLTGFSDALAMRVLEPGNQPSPDIAPVVGANYNETPNPQAGNQETTFGAGTPFFFPVRGGFFKFDGLTVVDAYGQNVNLMDAHGNTSTGVYAPVRGEGLMPTVNTKITVPNKTEAVRLTPRLVQPSRLNFEFLSATSDTDVLGQVAGVNPVCGWMIPNHLDRGLAIYDANGMAVGELLELANTTGTAQIGWVGAPDSPESVSHPEQITNTHLKDFVAKLLARQDGGEGFRNFLGAVDETLWTVDPLGGRADQNLSVLIGRPLAIVRARIGLELDGLPIKNLSWRDTLIDQGIDLDKLAFDVRLGSLSLYDDGVMGYFLNDDYTTFNSVHLPYNDLPKDPYLAQVGEGNFIKTRFDDTYQILTIVLDPRGNMHAFTGILPHKEVTLPNEFVEGPMSAFQLNFRAGPLITPPEQIRTPYPTERHGDWSWLQRDAPLSNSFVTKTLVQTAQQARLDETPPALVEGWLRFVPNQEDK